MPPVHKRLHIHLDTTPPTFPVALSKPVPAALWEPGWGEGARRQGREGKGEKFHLQGFLESGKARPGFKE
jgi:hypothetical protein